MSKTRIYARNLTANWVGYVAQLVVYFFLSPFLVHKLGDVNFGVWSLLVSLTGYLGLLELGVMNSTGRFVNYYLGKDRLDEVSKIVNTSLSMYFLVSLVLFVLAFAVQPFFGRIFTKIPAELAEQAGIILIIFCANIFLGFISATLRHLLVSYDRFDLQNISDMIVLGTRTSIVVYILLHGYGLIGLAVVQVCASLLGCSLLFAFNRLYGPPVHFGLRYISREKYKELLNFSVFAFIGEVGTQVIFYTDSIVIALLIGTKAVTLYSIALTLINYPPRLVIQISRVIMPDIMKSAGKEDLSQIRWLLLKGTRVTMLLAVPMLAGFIVFGKDFISIWMGPEYQKSAVILTILAIAQLWSLSARTFIPVLLGLGHVRMWSRISILEAALNLGLSVTFVKYLHFDITGVALGTLLPMTCFAGFVLPFLTCRRMHLDYSFFLKKSFVRWMGAFLLCLPIFFLVSRIPMDLNWPNFFSKVLIAVVLYLPIGLFIGLNARDRRLFSTVKTGIVAWTKASP